MEPLASLKRRARAWRGRWTRFAETERGKRRLKYMRYALTAAIGAYLLYQFTNVGWANVWAALPRTPWFYVIFVGMYFTLPTFQAVIFGMLWKLPVRRVFPAALKKRVYNKDVLGYSGDVYLYFWGRRRIDLPPRTLLHHLKDNAVVSSIVSTLVAVGLLAVFFMSGLLALPELLQGRQVLYATAGVVVAVVAIALGVRFRRKVFLLPANTLLALAGLHLARLLVVQSLQITQWSVVLPAVPLTAWFTYLAVQIIVSRIPFLPSRDLIFMSVGIGMAGAVGVPEAAVAGILGVHSILDKSLNFVLFTAVSYFDTPPAPPPEGAPEEAPGAMHDQPAGAPATPAGEAR